ncbi:MAG: DNA polymerase II [Gammaproteobacteria bacterium]|nr:DNA polymerase II [Gammaproteobacteria bacterium]
MPDPSSRRGFIFQASYRIQAGVPVVHLFGRLENGDTFLVRDRRQTPHFYVPADAPGRAEAGDWQGARLSPSDRIAFSGEATRRVSVPTPPDAPPVRDRLHARGIDTFEADVRFAMRYLIDRNIKGGCSIHGAPQRGSGCRWVFDDPELAPAPVDFRPNVLSFDIETDARAQRLLAIALYGCGVDEVYIVDGKGREMPARAVACANERAALDAFSGRVRELDADVLTGWNVIDFDLTVLARIAARLRHPLQLGREPGRMSIRPAQGYFGSGQATVPGRLVLDGVDLLRGAFVRMDEYSLDAVARSVLGEGKTLTGSAHDRVGEILRNYADDLEAFARYARTDARLALDVVERLDLVNLAVARSRLTGMPPDRVAASIASFDFLYLAELHKRRIVAPSVRSSDSRVHVAQAGGHVLEPVTGLHEGVWVFDFKSLYPSVIRTYNIDPLGYIDEAQEADDPIELAGGARFRRTPGILPSLLDDMFPRREQARRDGDQVASQAIKILMNSFYGVLGTPACRFYNPAIANAITGQGRRLLLWSKRWFEKKDYQVLYGDTDSLFVACGSDADGATERGLLLAAALTADLAEHVRRESRVESRLELELEKFYSKLFLPVTRSGSGGARKRYAGQIQGHDDVEFRGMEVVRRDWTELAKQVQRELYGRLFREEPIEDWLRDLVSRLRAGSLDGWLVYRKGLRKRVEDYRAQTPPHVAAARKSKSEPGRVVAYMITLAGPEPLDNLTAEPDREHYLARQVKPVAEPVLATLGLNFERVIGDDRQMGLF